MQLVNYISAFLAIVLHNYSSMYEMTAYLILKTINEFNS